MALVTADASGSTRRLCARGVGAEDTDGVAGKGGRDNRYTGGEDG